MADVLIATFDEVDAKPEVGALVLGAMGKSFCAGGDIATPTSAGKDPAAPEVYEGMGKIYDSFYRLVRSAYRRWPRSAARPGVQA
jgi:enoyl-CoA hydratase/carnithine racemase